jgi:DNA-binding Xre family transcriptional regulator
MVKWKLREYLDKNKLSAYALTKSAELAPNTVYALARGDQGRVDLEVLDKVLTALDGLTGKRVSVCDLLERE